MFGGHRHDWSKWSRPFNNGSTWYQARICADCGQVQTEHREIAVIPVDILDRLEQPDETYLE